MSTPSMEITPIPAFTDNYIWAMTTASGNCCVVDPGDATPVIEFLESGQLRLTAILITHHHPDHTGGLATLKDKYGAKAYGPQSQKITGIDQELHEGDRVSLLGLDFQVLEVPGHTLDHIAFYCASEDILFCGDTLFAMGCGRLFEGDPAMMHHSLAKLRELPPRTSVYCTHEYTQANQRFALAVEPDNSDLRDRVEQVDQLRRAESPTLPSTLELELRTNPFLRCEAPSVQRQVESKFSLDNPDAVEVFAQLRSWKDNF